MKIVGKSLVIPLIYAELRYADSFELGKGIHLIHLNPQYKERLKGEKGLVGGYQRSLEYMIIGLSIEPSNLGINKELSINELLYLGIFIFFVIRLVTDIPFDIPFWFDISSNGDILGVGQTQVRTYRHSVPYHYLLDEGRTRERLEIIRPFPLDLLEYFINFPNTNRIIQAIEFASIGFQTFHIPTRLVNQVTFMEIL
jgi:hypothetical protein